jgi:hypothetical protein
MALVLCTGIDFALTETRRLILEKAGHTVITALDDTEMVAACRANAFDIAVIGQIEASNIKCHFFELLRYNCCSAQILELFTADAGPVLAEADSWLEVPANSPNDLANKVFELANRKEKKVPDRGRPLLRFKRRTL